MSKNTYNAILDSITEEIIKCISLKSIREQISPMLKQVTDNDNEYDLLMEAIPYFYRDTYTKKNENIYVEDFNGNGWSDYGDEYGCYPPDAVFGELKKGNPMLLTMHNHPNQGGKPFTPFQSPTDYFYMVFLRSKYGVTISKDGIVITKSDIGYTDRDEIENVATAHNKEIEGRILLSDKSGEYKKSIEKLQGGQGIPQEKDFATIDKCYNDYLIENIDYEIGELNGHFNKNNIPVASYYVPIKG